MFYALGVASLLAMNCLAQTLEGAAETCETSTCEVNAEEATKGSAMLQVRQTASSSVSSSCSLQRAKQEPLIEEGFQAISRSCCYEDVKEYARRLIDEMGYKVCDEGGLSGIAPFYSCPQLPVSLAELKEDLKKALPASGSKCHWLQDRYAQCTEPGLECAVFAIKPPPAPQPVASGFIAFKAANPSEMMRSNNAMDAVKYELSLALGVLAADVNVVLGSGPLDGEEVDSSLLLIPKSQAFYSLGGNAKTCKVFAVYSIQEPAPNQKSITTPAPRLDEQQVVDKLTHLDTGALGNRLTQDLGEVDKAVGTVEVIENTICEKTSFKCRHEVIKESL